MASEKQLAKWAAMRAALYGRQERSPDQRKQAGNRKGNGQFGAIATRCQVKGCKNAVQYENGSEIAEGAGYSEKIGGEACGECFKAGKA